MGQLFGTDGIRGRVGDHPMTLEMVQKIGRAVGLFAASRVSPGGIIIGRDTRISGPAIEEALAEGVVSAGVNVDLAGVIPTPGIAFLVRDRKAAMGIVISASHNPYHDNGIKLFGADGYKFPDETESEIEALVFAHGSEGSAVTSKPGKTAVLSNAAGPYAAFLKGSLPPRTTFRRIKMVLDCANGAASGVAPAIFSDLGADVLTIFHTPDGRNINDNCGSQHTDGLAGRVLENKADIGLAFDGDADRLIAVDEKGRTLTGDQVLTVCAAAMKRAGTLANDLVVSTVMSNLGFGIALKKMGIRHLTTPVGDRHVVERMRGSGAVLGGEDSGHIVLLNHHTTGDGILTALQLTRFLQLAAQPLSRLSETMTVYPQVLVNTRVASQPDIETVPEIQDAIHTVEKRLGEEGRALVRYSGTEPLCRVMVEAHSRPMAEAECRYISDIVTHTIG